MKQLPQKLPDSLNDRGKQDNERKSAGKRLPKLPLKQLIYIAIAIEVVALIVTVLRPAPILVDIGKIQRGELQVTVDAEGKTRVRNRFTIAAAIDGNLARIPLEEGDTVKATGRCSHRSLTFECLSKRSIGTFSRVERPTISLLMPKLLKSRLPKLHLRFCKKKKQIQTICLEFTTLALPVPKQNSPNCEMKRLVPIFIPLQLGKFCASFRKALNLSLLELPYWKLAIPNN
jgi:hypothetical protein